jgi:hypothetical protein
MQAFAFVCAAVPLALTGGTGLVWANPYEKTRTDRVLSLIYQLGDNDFAKREAASRELAGIGEPALAALRNALASSGDLEVRRRAERIIQMIADRAAKTDKERLQGAWTVVRWERDGFTEPAKHFQGIRVIFDGDKVVFNAPAGFVYPYELGAGSNDQLMVLKRLKP